MKIIGAAIFPMLMRIASDDMEWTNWSISFVICACYLLFLMTKMKKINHIKIEKKICTL